MRVFAQKPWAGAVAAPLAAAAVLEYLGIAWFVRPALSVVLAALALAVVAAWMRPREVPGRRIQLVEAGALLAAAVFAPGAWRIILLVGALGSAACALGRTLPDGDFGFWRRLTWSLRTVVLTCVVTALAVKVAATLALTAQSLPAVAGPLELVLKAVKIDAAAFGRSLAFSSLIGSPTIPMTWSHLGLFTLTGFITAFYSIRFLAGVRPSWQVVWQSGVILFCAWLVRTILILVMVFQYDVFTDMDLVDWPAGWLVAPLLQMMLLALVASPLLAAREKCWDTGTPGRTGPVTVAPKWMGVGFAAVALVAAFLMVFDEPGVRKPGRVVIDEGHSGWEPVEPAYDTEWYGADSGYNYAVITEYLRRHYDVEISRGDITDEVLRGADVLIVKIPTAAHSAGEIDAIENFVAGGGGLFLVGEHTNVWGSGIYLNALARRFGFEFRYDVVFDLRDTFSEEYRAPAIGKHPVLKDLERFYFAVGGSVVPRSPAVRPVMAAGGLWSLDIEYAVDNFYPAVEFGPNAVIGPHAQFVAKHHGRGRVAGFTDSTVWSTFCTMLPGKAELMLGTVEWLNRRNRLPDTFLFGRILAMLLGIAVLLVMWRWTGMAGVIISVSLAGAMVGARLGEVAMSPYKGFPQPKAELARVTFIQDDPSYEMSMWSFTESYERSYAIFYQWLLRVGLFPAFAGEIDPLPANTNVVVRVIGAGEPTPETEKSIQSSVENGVPVLFLVRSDANRNSLQLLESYGLQAAMVPFPASKSLRVSNAAASWPIPWEAQRRLTGGTAILEDEKGRAVFGKAENAPVYVFLGADRFTDVWMGRDQGRTPTLALRRLFELQFSLFRGLRNGGDLLGELEAGATRPLTVPEILENVTPSPLDRPAARVQQ